MLMTDDPLVVLVHAQHEYKSAGSFWGRIFVSDSKREKLRLKVEEAEWEYKWVWSESSRKEMQKMGMEMLAN